MDTVPKTFGQKLWSFVEGALFQSGVGLVLLVVGALWSLKLLMELAFVVLLIAAYRAGLFEHKERRHRIASYIGIPVGMALVLILIWLIGVHFKGTSNAEAIATQTKPVVPPLTLSKPESTTNPATTIPAPPSPASGNAIAKPPLTDKQQQEIVNKIIERYKKKHNGRPPTIAAVNERLKQQGQAFTISESLPKPNVIEGTTFRDNKQGAIHVSGGAPIESKNNLFRGPTNSIQLNNSPNSNVSGNTQIAGPTGTAANLKCSKEDALRALDSFIAREDVSTPDQVAAWSAEVASFLSNNWDNSHVDQWSRLLIDSDLPTRKLMLRSFTAEIRNNN